MTKRKVKVLKKKFKKFTLKSFFKLSRYLPGSPIYSKGRPSRVTWRGEKKKGASDTDLELNTLRCNERREEIRVPPNDNGLIPNKIWFFKEEVATFFIIFFWNGSYFVGYWMMNNVKLYSQQPVREGEANRCLLSGGGDITNKLTRTAANSFEYRKKKKKRKEKGKRKDTFGHSIPLPFHSIYLLKFF